MERGSIAVDDAILLNQVYNNPQGTMVLQNCCCTCTHLMTTEQTVVESPHDPVSHENVLVVTHDANGRTWIVVLHPWRMAAETAVATPIHLTPGCESHAIRTPAVTGTSVK